MGTYHHTQTHKNIITSTYRNIHALLAIILLVFVYFVLHASYMTDSGSLIGLNYFGNVAQNVPLIQIRLWCLVSDKPVIGLSHVFWVFTSFKASSAPDLSSARFM